MLSNIYMRRFVKGWKTGGHERRLDVHIVNYADDFVICCRGTAESYLGPRPSRKKVDRLCGEISELTARRTLLRDVDEQIGRINRKLRGWSNYFRIGTVSRAYRNVDSHVRHRVRQWLCAKSKARGQGKKRYTDQYLYQKLRLHQLQRS